MPNNKAIPEGYMTVGEVTKKTGITIRTLQYYDRVGLLSPSAASEGGRRLYTDKDVVKLHQILSLKHLGFSLDDIKNRVTSLDTPQQVASVLTEQAAAIQLKLDGLLESLKEIEALKAEVLQMQQVDFKKYADIIVNLQMKNEFYWMIKHFDDKTLDHLRKRFSKDSGSAMMENFTRLIDEAVSLERDGALPDSERSLDFAKRFWEMIIEFTDGDMSMLPKLMETASIDVPDHDWKRKMGVINTYVEPVLGAYFAKLGYNPFENQ